MVIAGLVLAGGLSRGLVSRSGMELRARQPAWRADAMGHGPGGGALVGFRALAADFLWLRVNVSWENRDLAGTLQNLRLTTVIDPRPLVFWLNGARMMAYDMPVWRGAVPGVPGSALGGTGSRIVTEQARLALAWLDEAAKHHPAAAAIFIEQANIWINCLHDPAAAAACYRRAAEQPGAPHYAARLHAEMLRRAGRPAEALAWLVELHPRLPRGDEAAASGLVLARIRDLEAELAVPPDQRYRESEL